MKIIKTAGLFFTVVTIAAFSGAFSRCLARVNFIEPFKPGVDTAFIEPNDYSLSLNVQQNSDDKLPNIFAMPAAFSYGISKKMESTLSMGLVSYASQTGISDLDFGMKYLLDKGICGEFGILLPTADYKRGLGSGGVAFKMNWLIERQLKSFTGFSAVGYNLISANIYDPAEVNAGNVLTYRIGAAHYLEPTLKGYIELKGMNHAVAYQNGKAMQGSAYNELYIAPGIDYRSENLYDFHAAVLVGLTSDSSGLIFFVGMDFK